MNPKNLFKTITLAAIILALPASIHAQAEPKARPATQQEKEVAIQMAKQGTKMAKQGVKMASTALTNPKEAQRIADQMQNIGDEMQRLGDSLETLSEDTTFLYEGEVEDSLQVIDEDIDNLTRGFTFNVNMLNSWWGKIIGLGIGLIVAFLAITFVLLLLLVLFLIFTAPFWILALIIWLVERSNKKKTYRSSPFSARPDITPHPSPSPAPASPLGPTGRSTLGEPSSTTVESQGTQPSPSIPTTETLPPTEVLPPTGGVREGLGEELYLDEYLMMWKSGVMYCCIGVGLTLLFLSIGFDELWGVGALIACIGVAKLVIAKTTKDKKRDN